MVADPVDMTERQEAAGVMPRKMTGADILFDTLVKEGVEVIFGYPGGSVIPVYHQMHKYPLRHILVRHEQAAAHAADAYARVAGKPGVCLATSGPGATNLVTGIANAYLDSVPMVALTGQVATSLLGKDAFQEVDSISITKAISKAGFLVRRPEDMAETIKKALFLATSGRPGPVVVDLPKDVSSTMIEVDDSQQVHPRDYSPVMLANMNRIKEAADLLNEADNPVILVGGGVVRSEAYEEVMKLAELSGAPVATTLMGKSAFPESHSLSIGMAGMHGNLYANKAIRHCDVLLALGVRFSDRLTGKVSSFAPRAKIVHVDVDPKEIGKNVRADLAVVGNVKEIVGLMLSEVKHGRRDEWQAMVNNWRVHSRASEHFAPGSISPKHVLQAIEQATNGDAIMVTDVGQNQMWTAQYYQYNKPNTLVTSGGLGCMGFGLPAAIGAQVAAPDRPVWCVAGDGGIQMTIEELCTLTQEGLPVKIAIMNNGYLGMVRQWQELFFERRYAATEITSPDFVAVCGGYGVQARRVCSDAQVDDAVRWANECDGPVVVEFVIESEANVYPIIPPGASVNESIIGKGEE